MNSQMGIRDNIRKQVIVLGYGGNLSRFAKEKGFSNSYLNEILNGKRRFNEDWLNKIAKALEVEPWQLLSDRPLIPYESKEPTLVFNMPDGEIEGVKVFDTPACLGPGFNMDECAPSGYMPIPKKDLPRGFKSDPNRIICLPTKGTSMVPTILPDSYIWVDRFVPAEAVLPGRIYAFLLPDRTVTIKRLVRVTDHCAIIDADNSDPAERKETGSLKDFPMILPLQEDQSVVRGRVIWILNRLVEKPKR
jgi:phage repressor protein C with HTH and peptisase S24 domain